MSFMRPFLPFADVDGLAHAVSAGVEFAPVSMVAPEVSPGKMSVVGIAYSSLCLQSGLGAGFFLRACV